MMVPFVLLFGRHWCALISAGIFAAVLSLAVTLAFGAEIWLAWMTSLGEQAATLTSGRAALLDLMPTVSSAVLLAGGGTSVAHAAQAMGALAGLLALWQVRARRDFAAQAVLPLATLLATPYAFDYDVAMVTGAVMAVIAARIEAGDRFTRLNCRCCSPLWSSPPFFPHMLAHWPRSCRRRSPLPCGP